MNILKIIIALISRLLKRKEEAEPGEWWETNLPTSQEVITGTDLWKLLNEKFPNVPLYLSDALYLLAKYDDIALFLAQDQTNKFEYKSQSFDCDNFSYRLMGQFSVPEWSALTFGIMWTQKHALNIVVTEDKEVFFVEPQADELLAEPKGSWGGIRFIIM